MDIALALIIPTSAVQLARIVCGTIMSFFGNNLCPSTGARRVLAVAMIVRAMAAQLVYSFDGASVRLFSRDLCRYTETPRAIALAVIRSIVAQLA